VAFGWLNQNLRAQIITPPLGQFSADEDAGVRIARPLLAFQKVHIHFCFDMLIGLPQEPLSIAKACVLARGRRIERETHVK